MNLITIRPTYPFVARFLRAAHLQRSFKMMFTSCKRHVMIPAIQAVRLHQESLSGPEVQLSRDRPACQRIQESITIAALVHGQGGRSKFSIFSVFYTSEAITVQHLNVSMDVCCGKISEILEWPLTAISLTTPMTMAILWEIECRTFPLGNLPTRTFPLTQTINLTLTLILTPLTLLTYLTLTLLSPPVTLTLTQQSRGKCPRELFRGELSVFREITRHRLAMRLTVSIVCYGPYRKPQPSSILLRIEE